MLHYQKIQMQMDSLSSKFRGIILSEFTFLENAMEDLIANYYTGYEKKKTTQLRQSLLSSEGFSFHIKKTMLLYIAKSFEAFKEGKKLEDLLSSSNTIRNYVAHRKMACADENLKGFDGKTIFLYPISTNPKAKPTKLNESIVKSSAEDIQAAFNIVLRLEYIIRKTTLKI